MKKITSKYQFSTGYTDLTGKKKSATVELTIDYNLSRYDVRPLVGDSFMFVKSSNAPMWKAVLKSISDAIDFAEAELNPEKSVKYVEGSVSPVDGVPNVFTSGFIQSENKNDCIESFFDKLFVNYSFDVLVKDPSIYDIIDCDPHKVINELKEYFSEEQLLNLIKDLEEYHTDVICKSKTPLEKCKLELIFETSTLHLNVLAPALEMIDSKIPENAISMAILYTKIKQRLRTFDEACIVENTLKIIKHIR